MNNGECYMLPIRKLNIHVSKFFTNSNNSIFINIINFCYKYDLNEDDILLNFSNLGWNKTFGVRIVDFGLTNEMNKKFLNN